MNAAVHIYVQPATCPPSTWRANKRLGISQSIQSPHNHGHLLHQRPRRPPPLVGLPALLARLGRWTPPWQLCLAEETGWCGCTTVSALAKGEAITDVAAAASVDTAANGASLGHLAQATLARLARR